jgi:hypothetical protein
VIALVAIAQSFGLSVIRAGAPSRTPPGSTGCDGHQEGFGSPLVNELIIGIGDKDRWNRHPPVSDGNQFFHYYHPLPLLAELLPVLYPGVFPNLAAHNATSGSFRPDLEAIFLTGIPLGALTPAPGFTNYNGTGVRAEELRLNTAIAPSSSPSSLGLLALDAAGFPNGRRVFDDVATIALRAVAGVTLALVSGYVADGAAGVVDFGVTTGGGDLAAKGTEHYLSVFPYLGTPYSGYSNPATTPVSVAPGGWGARRRSVGRAQSSSTSAATSVRPLCMPRRRSPEPTSRSGVWASGGPADTWPCGPVTSPPAYCTRPCSTASNAVTTRCGSSAARPLRRCACSRWWAGGSPRYVWRRDPVPDDRVPFATKLAAGGPR